MSAAATPQPSRDPVGGGAAGSQGASQQSGAGILPPRPWLLRGFHAIAERRLRKGFRAVRLANEDALLQAGVAPPVEPLVFYLNHPSWWDPLAGFVLARHLIGRRAFYAPMDAEALRRYRLLAHLGMFPVEMDSSRGAAQFLHAGDAVLRAGHVLAVTAQGHFADVRERPLRLKAGLAALLHRRARSGQPTTVVPLALEYTFWDQRLPECLAMVGDPWRVPGHAGSGRAELHGELESRLGTAQDRLAALSLQRDAGAFRTVVEGHKGVAGWYNVWERLHAFVTREEFRGDHSSR